MADDAIGSLRANVSVDLSELQNQLGKIPAMMAEAAAGFANSGDLFDKTVSDISSQFKSLQSELDSTKPKVEGVSDAVDKSGGSAHGAAPNFHELKESVTSSAEGFVTLLEKIGLAVGAFEIIKESLKAFSEEQDIATSFTLLSGSAEKATAAIEKLKEMASEFGIAEGKLMDAAARLAPQLGVGTKAMTDFLQASADGAAGAHRSFDEVSRAIERVILTGQLGKRQLDSIGISMGDIATTMRASVAEAEAALKGSFLDANQKAQILIDTIERRFPDAAKTMGQNLGGQFQSLKNQLENLSQDVGKALAPVATELMTALKDDVIPGIKAMVDAFASLPEPVQKAVIEITALFAVMKFTGIISGLGAIAEAIGAAGGAAAIATPLITGLGIALNALPFVAVATAAGLAGVAIAKMMEGADKDSIARQSEHLKGLTNAMDGASHKMNEGAASAAALDTVVAFLGEHAKSSAAGVDTAAEAAKNHAIQLSILNVRLTEARKTVSELKAQQEAGFDVEEKLIAARNRENEILQKLNPSLRSIFATTKDSIDVSRESQEAVLAEATARQTSLVPAKELEEVTKAIQSAEDAIAAAARSTYIPAIMDHSTALENLDAAHGKLQEAIAGVRDAEQRLKDARDAQMSGAASPGAIKAAEDALEATKRKLTQAVTELRNAEKDESESRKLLNAIDKELAAGEALLIDSRKKLYPATGDLRKLTADFMQALRDARQANQEVAAAEQHLYDVRNTGTADTRTLIDAEDNARRARENAVLATKNLDDKTAALSEKYRINRDLLILLKRHNDDWSASTKQAQIAISDLGITSGAVLQDLADRSRQSYKVVGDSNLSAMEKARALQVALQDQINANDAVGVSADALKLRLAHLTEAINLQREGWAGTILAMHDAIGSGMTQILDDLIFHIDRVGDDFKKLGEQVVDIFANHILKLALEPVLAALDNLILKGIEWLGKLLGFDWGSLAGSATNAVALGANTTAITANTAALGALTAALGAGTVAGAAGSAAGGTGGIGGAVSAGLAGTVSAITGVVSAITGVIGVFQAARQEGTLNAIEQHTKVMSIALLGTSAPWETVKEGQDTIFFKLGDIKNVLVERLPWIAEFTHGAHAVLKDEILPTLKDILSAARDLGHSPVGVDSLVQTPNGSLVPVTSAVPVPINVTGNVYLDGQELMSSFVRFLEQSGTPAPSY